MRRRGKDQGKVNWYYVIWKQFMSTFTYKIHLSSPSPKTLIHKGEIYDD